jgi:DNA modification methylase
MTNPIIREVTIGNCRLIQGDSAAILPLIGRVDAIVTDPPYGLGNLWQGGGGGKVTSWKFEAKEARGWDAIAPINILKSALALAEHGIVWGGNYFELPPQRGWLIWDKIVRNFTTGVAELAWTNLPQPIKAFNFSHGALASEGKMHPTQKPLALMLWCLNFIPNAQTILDPFMGSGTTGVACVNLGRSFIGIEQDPDYFDICVKRITEAHQQSDLFVAKPAPTAPTQTGMDL